MTFATRTASSADASVVGGTGIMGDTRTHIFRVNTDMVDSSAMFSPDGSSVLLDDQGRAAVTVDFVCLRCHNGVGAFEISLGLAADIARDMHAND